MRQRSPRPRQTSRRAVRTSLIYCGGLRTERSYLDGLKATWRDASMSILVRGTGIAPDQLVRAAAAHRNRKPGVFDEVWCVVDVDQFDVASAVSEARRQGVSLAVSNPCFELWLLLHHAGCRAACAGCTDVLRRLRRHLPMYDKSRLDFRHFAAGVHDAVKRARDLDPTGADWRRNPSTNVWQLVERILEGT